MRMRAQSRRFGAPGRRRRESRATDVPPLCRRLTRGWRDGRLRAPRSSRGPAGRARPSVARHTLTSARFHTRTGVLASISGTARGPGVFIDLKRGNSPDLSTETVHGQRPRSPSGYTRTSLPPRYYMPRSEGGQPGRMSGSSWVPP